MNWHHCPTIHCFMVYVTPRKAESQLLRHILCLEPSVFEPVLYLLFTGTWCWSPMEVRPSQVKIPCPDELAPWNNDCKTSSCWDMLGCLFDFHPSNLVTSPFSSCSILQNLQSSQVSFPWSSHTQDPRDGSGQQQKGLGIFRRRDLTQKGTLEPEDLKTLFWCCHILPLDPLDPVHAWRLREIWLCTLRNGQGQPKCKVIVDIVQDKCWTCWVRLLFHDDWLEVQVPDSKQNDGWFCPCVFVAIC